LSFTSSIERGRRIAHVLRRCRRTSAAISREELTDLAPNLQDDGLSGLLWAAMPRELRRTSLGRDIRRGALADAAAAARLDGHLVEILSALAKAGVTPIVAKGWAVARYYPNPAMRPYSDLDLAIHPDQVATARGVLNGLGAQSVLVDLHEGLPDLPGRRWPEVFARSQVARLGGHPVRVLSPEDQFRWLTVHLVRHVCHRPMWLNDLATMLENVGSEMDWDLCLSGSFSWRRWTLAIAALAEKLLGAHVPESLKYRTGYSVPAWLEESTLWRWGGGDRLKPSDIRRNPVEWRPFVACRLLNPVRWSFRLGLPPMGYLPPIWAAAILGKVVQPFPRLWRVWKRRGALPLAYSVHTRRVF
jgi:hypothetical protein